MAQLVERLLPTPEIRSSNPDIYQLINRKVKHEEKEAGNVPSF